MDNVSEKFSMPLTYWKIILLVYFRIFGIIALGSFFFVFSKRLLSVGRFEQSSTDFISELDLSFYLRRRS